MNTILIVFYNIYNYVLFICSNKIYTTRAFEAYLNITNEQIVINNKPVAYRLSTFTIFFLGFLPNLVIVESLENYLNLKSKILFKIIISIILVVIILMLIINRINEYNYTNFINISINILFLFCFNCIIFDLILFITKYEINEESFEIIYVLIKLLASHIIYSLFLLKIRKYFESKISEILFQTKKNEKEINFLNSFYYLQEIMLEVKEKKNINAVYLINNFFNLHMNKCNKNGCNCKLLFNVIKKEKFENQNKELMKYYIKELMNILNYLFECSFIEYDYFNNYELAILLSEHFCHLKNNPTKAFALIRTLIIKNKNKFSKVQMINLYELLQKYIYYITANSKNELESENIDTQNKFMLQKQKEDLFKVHFNNSKIIIKIKNNITNYIENHIKILKYKNIFEESIKFSFDETNEVINCVKIQFFETISNIDDNVFFSLDKYIIKEKKVFYLFS